MKKAFASLCLLCISAVAQDLVGTALRASLNLNGAWNYVINLPQSQIPQGGWSQMRVPTAPFMDGTASVWYESQLNVRPTWLVSGRRFFLELEKCGHYCAIYLNGQIAGDHYGQFAAYEAEITPWIVPGNNRVDIYAHDADDTYTRRGATLNQSSCPQANPNCMANSYRPSALNDTQRDWVGLMGDITFSWRGSANEYVSDVQIISSVRNGTVTANISVLGASSGATVSASVMDGTTDVLDLPAAPVIGGAATLSASWTTATLWQPGNPKLYHLHTVLTDGPTADERYDRFGFREVWVSGTSVLLNGQPLWMTGDYEEKFTPTRLYLDRRPQAMAFYIQQQSGLTGATFHWDDAGRHFLNLADEMGIVVLGAFYCNGPDLTQSQVDNQSDWSSWMEATATEWAMAERNHPSIVMWRPMDVMPSGAGGQTKVFPLIATAVHAADTTRPMADDSDVDTWAQSLVNQSDPSECDNGAAFAQKLSSETKPLLIKELYGYNLPCTGATIQTLYDTAYRGGGVGLILQELGLFNQETFTPSWFSQSGIGNRATVQGDMPNWLARTWTPTNWSTELAALYMENTVSPFPMAIRWIASIRAI
ncbi:MAG: glycoside hydrolase family 2 TIM barrel-domain containing protein [Terriglobales bacterium]|jgi:hypothetical protein